MEKETKNNKLGFISVSESRESWLQKSIGIKTRKSFLSGIFAALILLSVVGTSFAGSGRLIDPTDVFNDTFIGIIQSKVGMGGIIYMNAGKMLNAIDTVEFLNNITFSTLCSGIVIYNQAKIGYINNTDFTGNYSDNGNGGTIYNNGSGTIGEIRNSTFTKNHVNGSGGAIYNISSNGQIVAITNVDFTGNYAGGSGGAIYNYSTGQIGALTNVNFTENYVINGNGGAISNSRTAFYNPTIGALTNVNFIRNYTENGKGGAIYNDNTITLVSGFFIGNLANGQANSIWNAGTLTINPAEVQILDMRDPMSGVGGTIAKTGEGLWALGGDNVFADSTKFNVNEGALYLYQKGEATNSNRLDIEAAVQTGKINLSGASSEFNLASGATLLIGVGETHEINSEGSLTLENGSNIIINYNNILNANWTTKDILKLTSSNLDNQSTILNPIEIIESWISDVIVEASWNDETGFGNRNLLSLNILANEVNPDRSGAYAVRASEAMALYNPANEITANRQKTLFADKTGMLEDSAEKNKHFWGTGFYNLSQMNKIDNIVGFDMKAPGIALGYDNYLSDEHFLGATITSAFPDYSSGNVSVDGNDTRLTVYGGMKLPKNVELNYAASYGKAGVKQDRHTKGDNYHAGYDYDTLSLSTGLGAQLKQGKNSVIRPYANYEYFKVNTDGYSENGLGDYALTMAGKASNFHRIRAGLDYVKQLTDKNNNYLTAGLFWQGLFGDTESSTDAYLNIDPQDSVFISSARVSDENSLGVNLSFGTSIGKNSDLSINYTGLYGSDTSTQNVNISLETKF